MTAEFLIAPYIKELDLSRNEQITLSGERVVQLTGLHRLKLNENYLAELPNSIGTLRNLKHLSVNKNKLYTLKNKLRTLCSLQSFTARHNKLSADCITDNFIEFQNLSTLDLSHNKLYYIPNEMTSAKKLTVLNISSNQIRTVPKALFSSLTNLSYLNLSNNSIETLPEELKQLYQLRTLILNNNPLSCEKLEQLCALRFLRTLHLKNTGRSFGGIPDGLENVNLQDLDLSQNVLTALPASVYRMRSLKRLNISENLLTTLEDVKNWNLLQLLNVSVNKLTALPTSIVTLTELRILYANSNKLTFDGIPAGISKLINLEIFSVSNNKLEVIPEGLCRCSNLKKLILNNNDLLVLPYSIHFLNLKALDVTNNPRLHLDDARLHSKKTCSKLYYNIDFSLQYQVRIASNLLKNSINEEWNDDRNDRRRRLIGTCLHAYDTSTFNKGQFRNSTCAVANKINKTSSDNGSVIESDNDCALDFDCSELFQQDIGLTPGLYGWEIENFLPVMMEDSAVGKFYSGDCYIFLKTSQHSDSSSFNHVIYYWIGKQAATDKKTCVAMYAVYLKKFLGVIQNTIREEQEHESNEFLSLFPSGHEYISGARTSSSLFSVKEISHPVKGYTLFGTRKLHVSHSLLHYTSLSSNTIFLINAAKVIYLWYGSMCSSFIRSKARLFSDHINRNERRNLTEIIEINQTEETTEFWNLISGPPPENYRLPVNMKLTAMLPVLYKVNVCDGVLNVSQIYFHRGKLRNSYLEQSEVYVLDCKSEIFVWFGKRSTRILRAAGMKLAEELHVLVGRPSHSTITLTLDGCETMFFKCFFSEWCENIPDKKTSELEWNIENVYCKTDLTALLRSRAKCMTYDEAYDLMESYNYSLNKIHSFIFDGKNFSKLAEDKFGIFYSKDSYLFIAYYYAEDDQVAEGDEMFTEHNMKCIVYFWQGREASNLAWFFFNFHVKKKFEEIFKEDFTVVKFNQQQEDLKFLSHFNRKFIIKRGSYKDEVSERTEMYELRWSYSPICFRSIQIDVDARLLCSRFCYILCVPLEAQEIRGVIYVWVGNKSNTEDAKDSEMIANYIYRENYTVQVISEGSEPEFFFWFSLGERVLYEKNADFVDYVRLFTCSNSKGYFSVSECWLDFCQDDLKDDDVMLLDTGDYVFIWIGPYSSEIEMKLSFKSAQLYLEHLKMLQPFKQRKLRLCTKNTEPYEFKQCFHGWSPHKSPPVQLERTIIPFKISANM